MEPHPTLPRPHPGPMLAEQIEFLGVSVAQAADAMATTTNSLHQLFGEKRNLTAEMALRFEASFGFSADTYMRLQKAFDLWKAKQKIDVSKLKKIPLQQVSEAAQAHA